MSEPLRTAKTLAEWEELDYFRRPRLLRRLKVWVTLLTLVGCLLLYGLYFVPGGKRLLQAGPVSTAHTPFANSCERCHTDTMQTVQRLWNVRSYSVSDAACQHCHTGPEHNPHQETQPHCASCHREHRGHEALARVEDGHCTSCHADLRVKDGSTPRFPHVASFTSEHPYGSLWGYGTPKDPGALKFNHKLHLEHDAKRLKPDDLSPEFGRAFRALKEQECRYCHEPDSDARYMWPVQFEKHCKDCHSLRMIVPNVGVDKDVQAAADALRRLEMPHPAAGEQSDVTLGAARMNYIQFATDFPKALSPGPARPLPGRAAESQTTPVPLKQWVDTQMGRTTAACLVCHHKDASGSQTAKFLHVVPPKVPTRWLPKSVFNHGKHPMLQCDACHEKVRDSTTDRDVLLPDVQSCVKCHNPQAGVRNDCLTCHNYHPTGDRHKAPGMTIDEFLRK
jgi:hypothetical protein